MAFNIVCCEGWFQFLDLDKDGKISGPQTADFFRRSNLSDDTLREIWKQTTGNLAHMTEVQFILAMKMVALAQKSDGNISPTSGCALVMGTILTPPHPKIRGFTTEEWQQPSSFVATVGSTVNQVQSTSSHMTSTQHPTPSMEVVSLPVVVNADAPKSLTTPTFDTSSLDALSTCPSQRKDSWCTTSTRNNSGGDKSAGSSTMAGSSGRMERMGREGPTWTACWNTNDGKDNYKEIGLQSFRAEDLKKATNGFSKCLGGGGYGEVYRGSINHVPVAVKILGQDVMQGSKEYGREVSLLGKMRHPHIVTLYGKCDELGALVYELLPGGNLEQRIECSPLPWEARLRIAKEVALGLYYLHNCCSPIVHRDLKPANVLLDANLTAKVGDMGLSRTMDPTNRASTVAGGVKGTFHYIAPEYENTGVYTTACDVFSFGVILLQLLTNQRPNLVREEVREAMRSGNIRSVVDQRPGTGAWPQDILQPVVDLGLRCCDSKKEKRPQMSEVVDALKELDDLCFALAASAHSGSDGMDRILRCPLTQKQLQDPVIADDGHTYERKAIQQWFDAGYNRSPLTNMPISSRLISNNIAKSIIALHARSQSGRGL